MATQKQHDVEFGRTVKITSHNWIRYMITILCLFIVMFYNEHLTTGRLAEKKLQIVSLCTGYLKNTSKISFGFIKCLRLVEAK